MKRSLGLGGGRAHSSPPPQVPLPSGLPWRLKCGVAVFLLVCHILLPSVTIMVLLSFLSEEVVILQQFQKKWDARVSCLDWMAGCWPAGAEGSRGELPEGLLLIKHGLPSSFPHLHSPSGSYRDKPELGSDQPKTLLRPHEQIPCD